MTLSAAMKLPSRILMTTDAIGGVWTYTLDLVRALGTHNVEVVVASMGRLPTAAQRAQADAVPNLRLYASEFKLEWMHEPWCDVREAGRWLLELEREHRPDLIHLNGFAHGTLPFAAPILMVGHSCVASWFLAVKGEDAPLPEWRQYRDAVSSGIRSANVLVAPTAAMLECLDRHYGPLPRSHVICNGRDTSKYRVDEKKPIVLSAGRLWDDAKNVAALADIAAELPWPVCVAGDSRSPDGGVGSFPNVEMLGELDEATLADWYSRAAIYALPARYEPFGLSALEAALSGCALVLGDIPSLREVWGEAAVFVPLDDRTRLRDAIRALINDDGLRRSLAKAALAKALTYTIDSAAAGYLDLYASLRCHRPRADADTSTKELACAS